jgi:aminopeptidase C
VVPQTIYPESAHSSSSGPLNKLLKTKLREHALILRNLSSSLRSSEQLSEADVIATLRSKKEELLHEVYNVMSATLGAPPQPNDKFVWDYYDKDEKPVRWEGTAKEFYAVRLHLKRPWFERGGHIVSAFRHSQTRNIQRRTLSRSSTIHAMSTRSFIQ